tara:strand:- start:7101 stop:7337 length:237 start_codon:yes stop_codon:yes gene_type:complete
MSKDKGIYGRETYDVGDLVRVKEGTHQDSMPDSRLGVITKVSRDKGGFDTGVYTVLFASSRGSTELTFWHKFLERVIK